MNVILSIKPEFVEKIFSKEKKYEYRKVLFKQSVDIVYIYACRPICKIVGEFKIEEIISANNIITGTWTTKYRRVLKRAFLKVESVSILL